MTVNNHPRQSFIPSLSSGFAIPSSTIPFTCFSSIFRQLFRKNQNIEKNILEFRSVITTLNFVLWTLNFDSGIVV